MATNTFNSDPANSSFEPLMSYFDAQGVNRLESANISSYGFDGFIPTIIENRTASGILPGMSISLTGSSTGQNFYKVLSNNIGDREFTASPSGDVLIEYLDNNQIVQILSASVSDMFSVSYENWDGKDLGTTGWYLGNSGNAIFSNVAVRGEIEATTLDVGGTNGITYDGNTVTIGASVIINAPAVFGGGNLSASYTTYNFVSASYADLFKLATSGQTIINGGNITTGTISAARIDTASLIVRNLQTYQSTSGTRIRINDVNNERHKVLFETGWVYETSPAYIGSTNYVNPGIGWSENSIGLKLTSGTTDMGATGSGPVIELQSYRYVLDGRDRKIRFSADEFSFVPYSTNAKFGITSDNFNVNITSGDVSFTGIISGNGSGLTNVPYTAYVLSTSGPSSPSSYPAGTVWYVY